MAKVVSKANQSQGMLVFKLTLQQYFAIGTLKVREIVPYMPTTKIPYSHQHVIGTVTIRNLTVPVIDMSAAVGFHDSGRRVPKLLLDCDRLPANCCCLYGSKH